MTVIETELEDHIHLSVEGRIDVISATKLEEAIMLAFQKKNDIIVNLKDTEYISSAGLRAFLMGQKLATSKGGSMLCEEVPLAVKSVMDITGFSNILSIED